MPIPSIGGGYQPHDGNLNEVRLSAAPVPATATSSATLTVDKLINGILLGSPGATAASYTLPTVTELENVLSAARVGSTFDFNVINIDGSAAGVITLVTNTGWTLVGLMTVAATAGTAQMFRARKTGLGAWSLYRLG